jgi:hypothetical protein
VSPLFLCIDKYALRLIITHAKQHLRLRLVGCVDILENFADWLVRQAQRFLEGFRYRMGASKLSAPVRELSP